MGSQCYVCGSEIHDGLFEGESAIRCSACGNSVHDSPNCRGLKDGSVVCGICSAR